MPRLVDVKAVQKADLMASWKVAEWADWRAAKWACLEVAVSAASLAALLDGLSVAR